MASVGGTQVGDILVSPGLRTKSAGGKLPHSKAAGAAWSSLRCQFLDDSRSGIACGHGSGTDFAVR